MGIQYDGHDLETDYKVSITKGYGGQPDMPALAVSRAGDWPLIADHSRPVPQIELALAVKDKTAIRSKRRQLQRWLDADSDDEHTLTLPADGDLPERWVKVWPRKLTALPNGVLRLVLDVSGDVMWHKSPADWLVSGWVGSDSGVTPATNIGGDAPAWPIIRLQPTEQKTSGTGYQYRRWAGIFWPVARSGGTYPYRVAALDTTSLVSASKLQSSGNDLRVFVDGSEVDRWLTAVNVAATSGELVGSGDGSTTHFEHTCATPPIYPTSIVVHYTGGGTAYTAVDDGGGGISGANLTGTIDYRTGDMVLDFSSAPDDSTDITVDYSTATNVWANLSFDASQSATLKTAFASGDSISTIDANEDISGFPTSGILQIGTEVFTYTGTDTTIDQFTGVSRAQKGSTAADHAVSDAIYWIQHDVWVVYGNSGVGAPDTDDDYKPAFELDKSDNDNWYFDTIWGSDAGLRAGQWVRDWSDASGSSADVTRLYTSGSNYQDPWDEPSIMNYSDNADGYQHWQLYLPTVVSKVTMNGHIYCLSDYSSTYGVTAGLNAADNTSSWGSSYLASTTLTSSGTYTWTNIAVGKLYIGFVGTVSRTGSNRDYVTIDNALVQVSNAPALNLLPELEQYFLNVQIWANSAPNDGIRLTANVALNDYIIIDCDAGTVYDGDVNLRNGLTVLGSDPAREHWLAQQPYATYGAGDSLTFEDIGTQHLNIDIKWDERYYE